MLGSWRFILPPNPPTALDPSGAGSQKTLFLSRISAKKALNAYAGVPRGVPGGVLLGPLGPRKAGLGHFLEENCPQATFWSFFSRKMASGPIFREEMASRTSF